MNSVLGHYSVPGWGPAGFVDWLVDFYADLGWLLGAEFDDPVLGILFPRVRAKFEHYDMWRRGLGPRL